MSNNNNYGELLCQAMGILADSALEKISFDRTILTTITDDSEKEGLGKYRVSTGEAVFDAYSSNTSFKKDDNVYVQIPNGDWNAQKFIIGKKAKNVNDPIAYKDPLDSFVDISENLLPIDKQNQFGLLANGSILTLPIWSQEFAVPHCGYSRLAISAQFKSLLKRLGAKSGDYGLILKITTSKEDKSYTNACILSCRDMIGDPYNFDVYFEQKKLFDISQYENISKMELWFFQDAQFLDINGTPINHENIPNNLFVNQISISLGYDISQFSDGNDALILYTMDSYQYDIKTPSTNLKELRVRWIHRFENNNLKVVNLNDKIQYTLTWYQQKFGAKSDNVYAGVDWVPLSRQEKTTPEADIIYNRNTGYYPVDITEEPGYNYSYLLPDAEFKKEEKAKVQIIYKVDESQTVITSNIITFSNVDDVVNRATVDYIQGLNIDCTDGTNGNYPIYGLDGKLLDSAESQVNREFKLLFFNTVPTGTEQASQSILTDATRIEWIIPKENTMIALIGNYEANLQNDGYYHIIKTAATGGVLENESDITLSYRIKSSFSYAYGNNLIRCNIIRNNKEYKASKELIFGTAGTAGTDYTFSIELISGFSEVQAMTVGSNSAVMARAILKDYKNTPMDISNKTINWSWTNYDSKTPNPYINMISSTGEEIELQLKTLSVPQDNYSILVATISDWGDYDLKAYLPIPITSNSEYSITGANIVKYNSLGNLDNHSFYNGIYELHGTSGTISWNIKTNPSDNYSPKLQTNAYILKLPPVYIEDSSNKVCVYAVKNSATIWSQPIYIYQEKYPSSIVNEWNGKLAIDNDTNSILAAKIVAGKKNGDNTFSGVMMGDWEGDETSHADGAITENTGIYGFQSGIPSFGFKDDGTAFIGKPGTGRLELNGNEGKIESSGYSAGGTGMLIDFGGESNKPMIDMKYSNNDGSSTSQMKLSADGSGSYIKMKHNDGTLNFGIDGNSAPKIEMKYNNGNISSSINLTADENGSEIYLKKNSSKYIKISSNENQNPLQIGNKFKVSWDGVIDAQDGHFRGELDGSVGRLDELTIDDYLYVYGDAIISQTLKAKEIESQTIYFGAGNSTQVQYYIRETVNSGWKLVTKEEYDAQQNSNLKKFEEKEITTNRTTGCLGLLSGKDSNGNETTVVGLQNQSNFSTVIEGNGNYLRIGNNKASRDSIILSGGSVTFQTDDYIGTSDKFVHERFGIGTNRFDILCHTHAAEDTNSNVLYGGVSLDKDEKILRLGSKNVYLGTNQFRKSSNTLEIIQTDLISLNAATVNVGHNPVTNNTALVVTPTSIICNCEAKDQHGIYARFA